MRQSRLTCIRFRQVFTKFLEQVKISSFFELISCAYLSRNGRYRSMFRNIVSVCSLAETHQQWRFKPLQLKEQSERQTVLFYFILFHFIYLYFISLYLSVFLDKVLVPGQWESDPIFAARNYNNILIGMEYSNKSQEWEKRDKIHPCTTKERQLAEYGYFANVVSLCRGEYSINM